MSKDQETTARMEPWSGAQPLLSQGVQAAQGLWGGGLGGQVPVGTGLDAPATALQNWFNGQTGGQNGGNGFRIDPYAGPRVAQLSPTTMGGINAMSAPNPLTGATQDTLLSNMNMDDSYRDFDMIRGITADNVKSNLASTFAGGSINSGLAGDTYTRAMTEALGGLEFGAYNQAKDRQLQSAGMAPSIAAMNRADAAGMLSAGGILDSQAQRGIDAGMGLHYEQENADLNALKEFANLGMGFGGMGGSQSQVSPTGQNIFSAGATGLGTYGALAGNPVTAPFALGGGILAGLGSIF